MLSSLCPNGGIVWQQNPNYSVVASGIFRKNIKRKTTDPVLSQSNLQQNTSIHVRVLLRQLIVAKGDRHLRKGSMEGEVGLGSK